MYYRITEDANLDTLVLEGWPATWLGYDYRYVQIYLTEAFQ